MSEDKIAQPTTNVVAMPVPPSDTLLQHLHQMNREVCVVRGLSQIAELPTIRRPEVNIVSFSAFANELYSNRTLGKLSIAKEWVKWSGRREVHNLAYLPGMPLEVNGNLNIWRPSTIKPVKGDLTPFNEYISHIFSSDPTYLDWFYAWLAYPFQFPGTKLHTACVFWSSQTGTGKSTLGYIMKSLYGEHNFAEISASDLTGSFNYWAPNRQFIMGDEIKSSNAPRSADLIKSIITRHKVTVNLKYKAQYEVDDCLNYYFTSNHPEAFYLDESERRFFVHELPNKKLSPEFYQQRLKPYLDNGGYAAILYHLLNDVDLSKPIVGGDPHSNDPAPFNRGASAPQSTARYNMIEISLDDAESWIRELIEWPPNVLEGNNWSIFTMDDLYSLFRASCPHSKFSKKQFAMRVHRHLSPLRGKNPITLSNGKRKLVYSMADECIGASQSTLIHRYESERAL